MFMPLGLWAGGAREIICLGLSPACPQQLRQALDRRAVWRHFRHVVELFRVTGVHVQLACMHVGKVGPEVCLVEGHPLGVAMLLRANWVAHYRVVGIDVTMKLTERRLLPLKLNEHKARRFKRVNHKLQALVYDILPSWRKVPRKVMLGVWVNRCLNASLNDSWYSMHNKPQDVSETRITASVVKQDPNT